MDGCSSYVLCACVCCCAFVLRVLSVCLDANSWEVENDEGRRAEREEAAAKGRKKKLKTTVSLK